MQEGFIINDISNQGDIFFTDNSIDFFEFLTQEINELETMPH